jgi:hypothetical protein
MSFLRYVIVVGTVLASAWVAFAANPVVLDLPERVGAQSSLITVADVARLSGGSTATRERIGQLDLAEFKPREESLMLTRRVVEYRLQLAGFDTHEFVVTGADRVIVALHRRLVTADEVVSAARDELIRRLAVPPESIIVDLVRPIAVKLPEVPVNAPITITAQPHGSLATVGRVQMDVVISCKGARLLALSVLFDVKSISTPTGPSSTSGMIIPTSGVSSSSATGPVLIRNQQRVTMQVRAGELIVTAVGEAQQEGRLGQSILVKNIDSKKLITARVTGPATVEVDVPTPAGGH